MAAQDLNIKIVASDQTGAAFTSVRQKMDGLSSTTGRVAGQLTALTATLASLATAGTALTFFSQMTQKTIALADALDELSARLNISVTDLSAMTNAAEYAGISQDELASSIMYLQKSIGEAAIGTKTQALAFKNLGINIKDAAGNIRPTVDILGEVADRMAKTEDGAIKASYQLALFGRSGMQLNEYLNKGSKGIKDYSNLISEEGSKAAADFNDNLTWMMQSMQSFISRNGWFLNIVNKEFEKAKERRKWFDEMMGNGPKLTGTPDLPVTQDAPKKAGPLPALQENDDLAKRMQEINKELEKIRLGEDAAAIAELKRLKASGDQVKTLQELIDLKKELKQEEIELQQFDRAAEEYDNERRKKQQDRKDAAKALYDSTRTGVEKLNIEMARLDEMLAAGDINWDTYSRAVLDAADQFDPFVEKGKDAFAELKDAINGWGNDFTNVMTESVMTGKLQFSDMANSIIKDIIRIQIQKSITDPLVKEGTSFLDGLLSGARAMGGPVTAGQSYLVGENGPEIFTPGASGGITPNGGGGGVSVNIINNSGSQASAKQTVDSRGNRRIEVTIGDMVAKEISRIGSGANNSIRSTFGASPALAGR